METTQKITHRVYWIVVALVGNALSWLVSAFTPVPQGAPIILMLGFAAWADLDYGLYGTEEDMRKRGFLIYGLATFFAFYLAFGRSGVQVASLEIPMLTLTLLGTYAVAWLVDHILPTTFGVPNVKLELDKSTAAGSWLLWVSMVLVGANFIGASFFGFNTLLHFGLTIMAVVMCFFAEFARSEDVPWGVRDRTIRSVKVYSLATITPMILTLGLNLTGVYHMDMMSGLFAAYVGATTLELILELRSGEIVGTYPSTSASSWPERSFPQVA